jgi:hypothetical protein
MKDKKIKVFSKWLHSTVCSLNHTDWCNYGYDPHFREECSPENEYYRKAEKLLAKGYTKESIIDVITKYNEIRWG